MVKLKLPITLNKKNGQINSYFKVKDLPPKFLEAARKKNCKFNVDLKGWSNG